MSELGTSFRTYVLGLSIPGCTIERVDEDHITLTTKQAHGEVNFYAFDDIEPETPIHTLVIPKKHYDNLQDGVPEELLGKLLKVVPEVAKIKGVGESGYRSIINTGPDSAATVAHLHVHILGGTKMGRFTFEGSQRLGN